MKTKKQLITSAIIDKAKSLAREPLTAKQLNKLEKFIASRLDTHGRYGYQFQSEAYYKKQFVPINVYNISLIANYVLECNFIKTN